MSNPIAGSLNTLLADSTVFYQKLRHYHWNVQGPKFFELHAKFEEIYEKWAPFVDQIAERIIALDEVPLHTLAAMLENATLKEDAELSDGTEMVNRTIDDLTALRDSMNRIIGEAEEAGDRTTANPARRHRRCRRRRRLDAQGLVEAVVEFLAPGSVPLEAPPGPVLLNR